MKVLITGATGFIGRALCEQMLAEGHHVVGTIRSEKQIDKLPLGVEAKIIQSIDAETNWAEALIGIDTVIHLAARVHILKETSIDPLKEFRKINTEGSLQLAREAIIAGVGKFVFMSTIGVNGNSSDNSSRDHSYSEVDAPQPHNLYSVSKREAEDQLLELALKSEMDIVIIRAPLVYGENNPGNFLSLLNIVAKGIPLPFASVHNSKSFIYIGNLVDALKLTAFHPEAKGIYLVSDGEDISTPELIRRMSFALNRPVRLFSLPLFFMYAISRLFRKFETVHRLLSSVKINSSKIRQELNWTPPYTMEQGLKRVAAWYLHTN